ncbi:acyl-CoA dehydrogenase [Subtercola boreus]|uniref:Acyl-CoA dehydrogenase n=2 Tax=Subtercola boreus TaxID=120213 RepID=A0A3E0VPP7_9MICO|nr:acyl-CoA dehydrogenase [Subtercola boreus]
MSTITDTRYDRPRAATPERASTDARGDFLGYRDLLDPSELRRLEHAQAVFEADIRPVIPGHWNAATFPFEVLPALADLDLVRLGASTGTCAGTGSALLHGFMHLELARVDASVSTFLGVHSVLFAGAIEQFGSDEQRARYLPDLLSLRTVGAFALTEPDHGSDISRAMTTTATRDGDSWILCGAKRWIGNATFADTILVWARDTADGEIKGFIVQHDAPGLHVSKIENKFALRITQNADILLDRVRVPEADRLAGATSFRETNGLLMNSRVWVAWQSVGLQFAAYDCALEYALGREQFGKPLASFQLVQDKLVRLLENATTSLGTMVRIAQLQQAGTLHSEQAALAKAACSARMRESVALGRGILGGNGISTDYGMARAFADAEAIFSYEGSYEINTLVVGRAITGISAF